MPIRTFKNKNLKGNFDTIPIKIDRLIQTTPTGNVISRQTLSSKSEKLK